MVVDSAYGDCFDAHYIQPPSSTPSQDTKLTPLFDGSASWFTQSHGHGNVDLTLAAASAAGRYGHVLFPSGTHAPALALAERLKQTVGKAWADRVFYSDNGSTGIEVALKMALRAAGRRYGWEGIDGSEVGVIGLRGGYHGDTVSSGRDQS
jgi:dethiobiotin synthetase/adenosylmethionine--8-amino-7-oxononanoate aminotransferase